MTNLQRRRLHALDACLNLLEDALEKGMHRINGPVGGELKLRLAVAGLIPDHRLEGRLTERVLDDVFRLQGQLIGEEDELAG